MNKYPRLFAFGFVLFFFLLILLYVKEFPVLSNTVDVKWLVFGSMLFSLCCSGLYLWWYQTKFKPWDRHLPEVFIIAVLPMVFSPLAGSLLNRTLGTTSTSSFEFVSEMPFMATGYGIMKGQKIQPTGYFLHVKEGTKMRRFRYKNQAYYPITKPGERVLLPTINGLFGFRVVKMED